MTIPALCCSLRGSGARCDGEACLVTSRSTQFVSKMVCSFREAPRAPCPVLLEFRLAMTCSPCRAASYQLRLLHLSVDVQKKTAHASEQHRPDVKAARELWRCVQPWLDPRRLVFIDETGTQTKMARLHGRAPRAGLQPDRAALLRAQGAPPLGGGPHRRPALARKRPHPRQRPANGVRQLLHQRRIRFHMTRIRSSRVLKNPSLSAA